MKKTNDQFLKELKNVNPNIKPLEKYNGANTKIKVKCKKCKFEWESTPSYLINSKQKCPNCTGNKKKTTEDFKNEVFDLVGEEYSVIGEYINTDTKIEIKHNICENTFFMTPYKFVKRGQRCTNPECYSNRTGLTKPGHLREKIEKICNETGYELLNKDQIDSKCILNIKHLECNTIFQITPNAFMKEVKWSKCPVCRERIAKETYTKKHEVFIAEMREIHENIEVLSEYVNGRTKVKCWCSVCGTEWDAQPNNLLSGQGCPGCRMSYGERMVEIYLKENNISFTKYYKYEGLIGLGGRQLSYDFYLPEYNILIEFQGQFHDGTAHQQTEDDFKIQQEHDKRKRDYANKHGISLLEIWYFEVIDQDDINDIIDEYIHNCVYGLD